MKRQLIRIWVDKDEPVTWRHFVLAGFWVITVLPFGTVMVIAAVSEYLAAYADTLYGKVKRWANPVRRGKWWPK